METQQAAVQLKDINTYFVGGQTHVLSGLPVTHKSMVLNGAPREVNPNGAHMAGQMYVQEYRLAAPRCTVPVVLWHGGGMTGCTWETKPGGGTGWAWRFLEAGYDVIVCDAVERGRSSFAMSPQIYGSDPVFRTKEEGWTTFRLGLRYSANATERHVHEGQRFPVEHFDDFVKQWVPRWPDNEARILAAYEALIRKTGRCFIVGHSQGAGFAAEIANRLPHLVAGVVAVEPGGVPVAPNPDRLPPHLVVWGDHIQASGPYWSRYRAQATQYFAAAHQVASVTELDLPRNGITGNSHFPMMDTNSDEVLALICAWIASQSSNTETSMIQGDKS